RDAAARDPPRRDGPRNSHDHRRDRPEQLTMREPDPRLKPEYARGDLVAVTTVPNQAEAEMVRDMLLNEGIPAMVRLGRLFDPRNLPAVTAHEVVVRASGYEAAHQLVHGELPPENA